MTAAPIVENFAASGSSALRQVHTLLDTADIYVGILAVSDFLMADFLLPRVIRDVADGSTMRKITGWVTERYAP